VHEKPTLIDKLGKVISIAGNAILMNLLFLLCSIPIVTMGQAWAALLTAIRYKIRGDKWQDGFWKGFKTRFWRGTVCWSIMAAVDLWFMWEMLEAYWQVGIDTATVAAGLVFALMVMLTFALQLLNVYIPTRVGDWLRNSANMIFKVPLELLFCAALFWAPFVLLFCRPDLFYYMVMIFITVYFVLVAMLGTLLMKNAIVHYLLQARADGTLIAEEGKKRETKEADEEETDEETEEA